ncbi:hypothetical protein HY501_03675 [Candidatus Woesearchaeota archaeon]|nr:hypothetical protein [Candidatus Woesearchaeota archaeon]
MKGQVSVFTAIVIVIGATVFFFNIYPNLPENKPNITGPGSCYAAEECEGNPHIECDGNWICYRNRCGWICSGLLNPSGNVSNPPSNISNNISDQSSDSIPDQSSDSPDQSSDSIPDQSSDSSDQSPGDFGGSTVECIDDTHCQIGECPDGSEYQRYACSDNRCVEINYFADPCTAITYQPQEAYECTDSNQCEPGICPDGSEYQRYECLDNRCTEMFYEEDPCSEEI